MSSAFPSTVLARRFYPSTWRSVHSIDCQSGAVAPGQTSSPGCIPLCKTIVSRDLQLRRVLQNASKTGGEGDSVNLHRIVRAANPQCADMHIPLGPPMKFSWQIAGMMSVLVK